MADVFISYHVKSAGRNVRRIAEALEKRNISCWYCEKDIQGGERFPGKVTEAVQACKVFLLILDEDAVQSTDVFGELHMASGLGVPVVPFMQEACEISADMKYDLSGVQILKDLSTPTRVRIENLAEQIAALIPPPQILPPREGAESALPEPLTLQQEAAQWNLSGAVEVLDAAAVEQAKQDFTEKDAHAFYRVSGNLGVGIRTLAAGRDVPRPGAADAMKSLLELGPVLITGTAAWASPP